MDLMKTIRAAGVAWSDKNKVEELIKQAKVLEGPKPSWQTGEFWFNVVLPVLGGMIGTAATVVAIPALTPYFVIATAAVALGSYLGRTWLKAQHLKAGQAIDLTDPDTMAQITSVIQNVGTAVTAMKAAKAGNFDPAEKVTETLNAVTINTK